MTYFTRSARRRKLFVLGTLPESLQHLNGSIPSKVWKQYGTLARRMNPIERAEFYSRELKERRLASFKGLSLLLGEPENRVGRYMKLLDLPEPIKTFVRKRGDEPQHLRYFTETRLQELVRVPDPRAQWRRFQAMVREAERDAGIWGNGSGK